MMRTLLAGAFIASAASLPAQAQITYQGSDTENGVNIVYSITTDGTLGLLSLANILSSSATFTGVGTGIYNFPSFTGHNNLYFSNSNPGGVSPVSADATSLFFNFAGGGTFNIGTADCPANNVCDTAPSASPNPTQAGLVFALAGAQSTDDDNIVFHQDTVPVKEIDDFFNSPNPFQLQPGTYTLVAPQNLVIASVIGGAVPEPASWVLMIVGMGAVGFAMRRNKVATRISYAA